MNEDLATSSTVSTQKTPNSQKRKQISSKKKITKEKKIIKDKDERLNLILKQKKDLVDLIHGLEDEELSMSDDNLEKSIRKMEMRDRYLTTAFKIEISQRAYIDFEDSESKDPMLRDVLEQVPNPIIIYDTDLEPLNQMLTDFVNKPGHFCADYITPEFEDIKEMLEKIRDSGECEIYQEVVSGETDFFVEFIQKIMGKINDRVKQNRFQNIINAYEVGGNEDQYPIDLNENIMNSQASNASFSEKLIEMKESGLIKKEIEPTNEETESLYDLQNDDMDDDDSTNNTPARDLSDLEENLEVIESDNDEVMILTE